MKITTTAERGMSGGDGSHLWYHEAECFQAGRDMEKSVSSLIVSDSVRPYGLYPASFLSPWDSPARILERVAVPASKGIFPTQGLNPCFLHLLPPVLADGLFYHQRHLGKEPVFKNRSYKTGRNGCSE